MPRSHVAVFVKGLMTRIPMIAIADFDWNGEWRAEGDRFEVPPVEAAALTYQRRARFVTANDVEPEPVVAAVPIVEPPPIVEKALTTRAKRKPRIRRDIPKTQHNKSLSH